MNQRGQSEYNPAWNGYSIDRWSVESDSEIVITLVNGGIRVKNTSNTERQFKQILPSDLNLAGKMITISALIGNVIGSVRYIFTQVSEPYQNSVACSVSTNGLFSASGTVLTGQQKIVFGLKPGAEITLLAVKLELGDQQTLAHKENGVWVLNEIPDYGEQLARCEYYRRVSASGHYFPGAMYSSADGVFLFSFTGGMRVTPSIEILLPGTVQDSAGTTHKLNANNYSIESVDRFGAKIVLHNLSGIPGGPAHICDARFALSADL
nr:MAG TPA: hypothetical protein [Caudoviricetes sp.]